MRIRSESEVKGQRLPRWCAKRQRAFETRNIGKCNINYFCDL